MKKIELKANAKINLSLDITAKRPDGYHDLATVMQAIDLFDIVTIMLNDTAEIVVTTDSAALCDATDNLAYRAACYFNERFALQTGYNIAIAKRIPIGAGLAGGSADAAAVIKGLSQLHGIAIDAKMMIDVATSLGADVPFCILGGTALAEGIGERLTPVVNRLSYCLVLVKPQQSVSTAQVFKRFALKNVTARPDNQALIDALQVGDLKSATAHMDNVLESVTSSWLAEIAEIKAQLYDLDAYYVQMSGSGPTVFAIFDNWQMAQRAQSEMAARWPNVFIAKPMT